jgi:hypothetical protein
MLDMLPSPAPKFDTVHTVLRLRYETSRETTLRVSANPKTLNARFRQRRTSCQHSSQLNVTTEKLCRSRNSPRIRWIFEWHCRKCRLRATPRRCSSCRFLYGHAPDPLVFVAKLRMRPSSRSSESCGIALVCEAYILMVGVRK